jgi:hypothetical protein
MESGLLLTERVAYGDARPRRRALLEAIAESNQLSAFRLGQRVRLAPREQRMISLPFIF